MSHLFNPPARARRMTRLWPFRWASASSLLGLLIPAGLAGQVPERPPLLGVAQIGIKVTDREAARAFYGGLLGLPEMDPRSRGAQAPTSLLFQVNPRQFIEILPGLGPEEEDRLSHIALETEDVEGMRRYLESHGIPCSPSDSSALDQSRRFTVQDPDGHTVMFLQYLSKVQGGPGERFRRAVSDRLLHVGITVADVAAADRFYRDLLGLSEFWRGGAEEGVTDWINMRLPEGTDYIEYMLVRGAVDRRRLGSAHHACLMVTDIQKALETLRERAGGTPLQSPRIGRNNRWLLNLFDPDGTRVELMEPHTVR